jgi:hypothetical protein
MSLFDAMQRFKSYSTARYRHAVNECGWPPFPGRLWQRGYYERIIRCEKELNAVRKYILENPMKWAMDKDNPVNVPGKKSMAHIHSQHSRSKLRRRGGVIPPSIHSRRLRLEIRGGFLLHDCH